MQIKKNIKILLIDIYVTYKRYTMQILDFPFPQMEIILRSHFITQTPKNMTFHRIFCISSQIAKHFCENIAKKTLRNYGHTPKNSTNGFIRFSILSQDLSLLTFTKSDRCVGNISSCRG